MNSAWLFICSIGPVQSFIAAARSSRDLAYGSQLLSELAKTAARTIAEKEGFDALIFPSPQDAEALQPGSELSVANKIVAVVKGDPGELAGEIEKQLQGKLLDEWQTVASDLGRSVDDELARWQIEDLLEFYWAATPFSDEGYTTARACCEAALAARKVTRDFAPHNGWARFKSSIDGEREHVMALVPDRSSSLKEGQLQRYKARRGELLSGVDLLKRWGKLLHEQRFRTNSHMAALPFMTGLGEARAKELHTKLATLFKDNGGSGYGEDYAVLYASEARAAFENEEIIDRVIKEQEKLLTEYAGRKRPGAYYAMLLADGDNMGKLLDSQTTPADHRRLSRALSEFASEVPKIIFKHKGMTVYAGGDDILAYLPLHTALKCVQELAEAFEQSLSGFSTHEGIRPTLSAGLAIVHHMEPLSEVLELVRSAEREAKALQGKNALAIALSKRSGTERLIRARLGDLSKRLETIIGWWRDGTVSKGTAYELDGLARTMEGILSNEALCAEAIRIVKRKRESRGTREVPREVIDRLTEWLRTETLSELAKEMIVAAEFASAKDMAEGQ